MGIKKPAIIPLIPSDANATPKMFLNAYAKYRKGPAITVPHRTNNNIETISPLNPLFIMSLY